MLKWNVPNPGLLLSKVDLIVLGKNVNAYHMTTDSLNWVKILKGCLIRSVYLNDLLFVTCYNPFVHFN